LFGRAKYIHDNGDAITGTFYSKILMTMMFVKLFEDFFNSFGVPIIVFYVAGILPIVAANFFIGFLNLRYGIMKDYNNAGWYNTPVAMTVVRKVDYLYKKNGGTE
jgi:hypothetical protein